MKYIISYDKIWTASWAADCKICGPKKLKFCSERTRGCRFPCYNNHQVELSAKSSSHSEQAVLQSAIQKNLKPL
jgi:hypothetical protein